MSAQAHARAEDSGYSGLQLEHLQGGNIPASVEEVVYSHSERKSSFTALAFALVSVALVWAGGAIIAGSPARAVSGGKIVAASSLGANVATTAIAGTTISAGFGAACAVTSALDQGVQLNDPQKRWLGDMGLQASQVPLGTGSPAPCTNAHCSGTRAKTSARHIQSSTNLALTRELVQGNCDVRLSRAQCLAQGLNPGQTPRSDSHPSAVTAHDFERKRQACLSAGQGVSQALLYRCMATAVYFTE